MSFLSRIMSILVPMSSGFYLDSPAKQAGDGCGAFVECMEAVAETQNECLTLLLDINLATIPPHQVVDKKFCFQEIRGNQTTKMELERERLAGFAECLQNGSPLEKKAARSCSKAFKKHFASLDLAIVAASRASRKEQERSRVLKMLGKLEQWQKKNGLKEVLSCRADADQLASSCKTLAVCCSAAPLCHLESEQTAAHDGVRAAELALVNTRRMCGLSKGGDMDLVTDNAIVANLL